MRRLSYDPATGVFRWLVDSNRVKAGDEAGCIDSRGYRRISVGRSYCKAHRLAWLFVHGNWPIYDIDHINGVRSDNRIENLRDAPTSVNTQNLKRARCDNKTSGLLGVSRQSGREWVAQIWANGRNHRLGNFEDPVEAHEAYLKAKRKLHAGCTL